MTTACQPDKPTDEGEEKEVKIPTFNADNAYDFVKTQVDFGPRAPNTEAHDNAGKWMADKLREFGGKVTEQKFQVKHHTGMSMDGTNIIAEYNPKAERRIVFAAHWDTRYIADQDKNEARQDEPILGADDGGSGVGVLLELARVINENPLENIGVDIVFFDLEDQGSDANADSWCLGAQYWSRNLHRPSYLPEFGILLDMVGRQNARFAQEYNSVQATPQTVKKVWDLAYRLGYNNYFDKTEIGPITDDHVFVKKIANINMIDIINVQETGFGDHWHTHDDNMDIISKYTLKAVGNVVTNVVYLKDSYQF